MLCALGTAIGGVVASRSLFSGLLANLLRRPLSFYTVTPMGQVLNRCSEDIAELDYVIPFTLRSVMNCLLQLIGTVGMIVYTTPLAAVPLPVLAVGYFMIQVGMGRALPAPLTSSLTPVLTSRLISVPGRQVF